MNRTQANHKSEQGNPNNVLHQRVKDNRSAQLDPESKTYLSSRNKTPTPTPTKKK